MERTCEHGQRFYCIDCRNDGYPTPHLVTNDPGSREEGSNEMSTKREKEAARQRATEVLHKFLLPGDTFYTVLRNVSRSGMSRQIDCYAVRDGEMLYLTGDVADLLGLTRAENGALKVGGYGLDIGFHVAYSVGSTLYPDGVPCTGIERGPHACQSNDHVNPGDRSYNADRIHANGGYAFRHQWI